MTGQPVPLASRPGSTFYVPEVRIASLPKLSKETGRRDAGTVLEPVGWDILRVEVTRVNTGAGQYSITLNNWRDDIPRRPVQPSANGRREWPRFKYNDFQALRFGNRLRIDMRYQPPDPAHNPTTPGTNQEGWVPMISGPITDMRFTFSSGEGARLTVAGEEDMTPLKVKNRSRKRYAGKSEEEIVRDVLGRADYPLPLVTRRDAWPAFAKDSSRALSETHAEGQSFLEYLQKFADRMDFEVFLEYASLGNPDAGIQFHFEPARSVLPPDEELRAAYVLEWGVNLLDFTPTIKVVDQYTKVTVRGRHRIRTRARAVDRVADPIAEPEILTVELPVDLAAPGPRLFSGPEWRLDCFGAPNDHTESNQTNLDDERAETLAQAILRRKAREFLTIEATTLGLPLLRPGRHIEVRGLTEPFEGFYYVTKSVHTFGEDGLRTQVTARRPGMPGLRD